MELLQLIYFDKVAELQHMTRAAQELHLAQPALSKMIKTLETELGVTLFDRIGKRIVLNQNGVIVQKYAHLIFTNLRDMQAELADNNRKVEKEITISMQSASKWLPVLISGFKKQYPDIKIAIVQHTNPMDTMRCDIRISSGRTKIEDTNTITLLEEEILLALPKEHPLATKSSIALTDVKDEPFISLQKGKPLREITDEYCRLAGFEPKVVLESDDPSTIRGFIHLGLGISFIPTITWNNIANSSIALLNISKPKCNRYIYLSWKNTTYISEATKLFRDYAVEFFQKLPLLATTPSSPASNSTDS